MNSILQSERKCYLTGKTELLHDHHIYGGSNRYNSEKYGLKIWLSPEMHNMSNAGVHYNPELALIIKRAGQVAFEQVHGSREEFMRIFGRNYLDEVADEDMG